MSDERRAEAARRLDVALADGAAAFRLSDVMYDAAHDGIEYQDGEGGYATDYYGYDLDDLAAVLLPRLTASKETQ